MSNAGIQGSRAGTSLRRLLASLANPTDAATEALNSLGIQMSEVSPESNSLAEIIDTLAEAGLSGADAFEIFGNIGAPGILALVANNDELNALGKELDNVNGEAERMATTMDDNLAGDVLKLQSAWAELALTIGEAGATDAFRGLIQALTTTAGVVGFMTDEVRELFGVIDDDDLVRLGDEVAKYEALLSRAVEGTEDWKKKTELLAGATAEYDAALQKLNEETKDNNDVVKESLDFIEESNDLLAAKTKIVDKLANAQEDAVEAEEDATKANDEFNESLERYLDIVDPVRRETRELIELNDTLTEGRRRGLVTDEEWAAHLRYVASQLQEVTVEAKRLGEQIEEVDYSTRGAAESSEAMAVAFDQGINRMRDGVGDFFQDIIDTGEFSFSKLEDLFNSTVAEMVATAATNTIFLGVGLGGSGSPQGGSLGSIFSEFGNLGAGAYSAAANGLRGLGLDSLANSASGQAGIYGSGGFGAAAYGAANAGAGIGGAYLANLAGFDRETSGLGSAAGGALGSIAGPIGTAVGSFLGEALESSLFGQDNNGNNRGRAEFDLSNATIERIEWGNDGGAGNSDAAEALAQQVLQFSNAIGGSDLVGGITVGNNDGIQYLGQSFGKDIESALDAVFRDVIEGATGLDEELKSVLLSSEEGAEGIASLANSLTAVNNLLVENPVAAAAAHSEALLQSAANSTFGFYQSVYDQADEVARAYDGTSGSAEQLALALKASQTAAFQAAVAFQQLRTVSADLFANSAKSIRQSVLSERELYNVRLRERNELRGTLQSLNDISTIEDTLQRINELNNQLFNSLEDPTAQQAEQFAKFAEDTGKVADQRLEGLINQLDSSQAAQMERIESVLDRYATQQGNAVEAFSQAVNTLVNGINNSNLSSNEVSV